SSGSSLAVNGCPPVRTSRPYTPGDCTRALPGRSCALTPPDTARMLLPMETPIRRQYLDLKRRYPHAILFFRLGDFYETFDDDALVVARELEIVLTSREMGRGRRVPLAGVPHHSLE